MIALAFLHLGSLGSLSPRLLHYKAILSRRVLTYHRPCNDDSHSAHRDCGQVLIEPLLELSALLDSRERPMFAKQGRLFSGQERLAFRPGLAQDRRVNATLLIVDVIEVFRR